MQKNMLLPENHAMFSYEEEIKLICAPLFRNCFINYFDYHCYYNDGKMFAISTNGELVKEYINQYLFPSLAEINNYINKYAYISPDLSLPYNDKRYTTNVNIAIELGIPHRMYFTKQFKNYYEVCGFGTNLIATNLTEFYTNNMDLFEKFIMYFRTQAYKIIQKNYDTRIILPININNIYLEQNTHIKPIVDKEIFLNEISQNKYSLLDQNERLIFITRREMECLLGICAGKSAKIIANELSISSRTVEARIESLKIKLNCISKHQLIQLAKKNQLYNFYQCLNPHSPTG